MTTFVDGDLVVTGALFCGNVLQGSSNLTPAGTGNEIVSLDVTGVNLKGRGAVHVFASLDSDGPETKGTEVTVSDLVDGGFTLHAYCPTAEGVTVHWTAMRLLT